MGWGIIEIGKGIKSIKFQSLNKSWGGKYSIGQQYCNTLYGKRLLLDIMMILYCI